MWQINLSLLTAWIKSLGGLDFPSVRNMHLFEACILGYFNGQNIWIQYRRGDLSYATLLLWTTGIFTSKPIHAYIMFHIKNYFTKNIITFYLKEFIIDINLYILFSMCVSQPAADFKEFELRLKFETRLKYGWFLFKLYSMFPNCAYDMYNLI